MDTRQFLTSVLNSNEAPVAAGNSNAAMQPVTHRGNP